MKALVKLFLLLPLVMFLACEDVVIGECPIAVIGDTVYVIPMETDHLWAQIGSSHNEVSVRRNYKDDGYKVEFYESVGKAINKIIITLPSTNVYILHRVREIGDDGIDCSSYFSWDGEDY